MANGLVVVTGGSRGIGEQVALASARAGHDVVLGFVSDKNEALAHDVASRVSEIGRAALVIQADLADPAARFSFAAKANVFARERELPWSTLVLNAANGMGQGIEAARAINTVGSIHLAALFMTHTLGQDEKVQRNVVYITSNPSHFWGHPKNVMPDVKYNPVAESKFEAEEGLRSMLVDENDGSRPRILVATSDLVEGTGGERSLGVAYMKLKGTRIANFTADRNAQLGELIGRGVASAEEFGGAIVSLFQNEELPNGHMLYLLPPVLGDYIVPVSELPFGLGADPTMYTFVA